MRQCELINIKAIPVKFMESNFQTSLSQQWIMKVRHHNAQWTTLI